MAEKPENSKTSTVAGKISAQDIASDQQPGKAATPPPSQPPPRGPNGKMILAVLIVGGLMLWVGTQWGHQLAGGIGRMYAAVFRGEKPAAATKGPVQYYTCGMHPWVILPKPGDCPICGMKLVPLDAAKFSGEVTINPVVAQDIGVRVSPVTRGPVVRTIRTVGTINYNETAVRDVNIKLAGWIEKLHVNYLGKEVKQGEPLFELYSPELYSAQQEYLLAYRSAGKSAAAASQIAEDVLQSARTRLEYFDISPEQIQALEQQGQGAKTMTIYSPYTGVVIAKKAFDGMRVEPGTQLYRIADLSKVWVMATLYEYQLPYVQVGQEAVMTLSYIPGQTFGGQVIYIYPTLDEKTRQVQVRLEFPNPHGLLKPGMFVEVQLQSTLADDRTLAPRSAIIDTGERKVAFVSLGDGRFEPRKVQTGAQTGDGMVEVLDGLKPGEQIVTSGQFLIDSEANVREALAKMIKGNLSVDQKAPAAPAKHGDLAVLPEAADKFLASILTNYVTVQGTLANDSTDGIGKAAGAISQQVDGLLKITIPDDPHFWHKHEEIANVRGKALELAQAQAVDQARLAFADLGVALGKFVLAVGVPSAYGKPLEQLHCPMFREGQGGSIWLQPTGEVRNPFFGSMMLGCFDQRHALPIAQSSQPAATSQPTMQMTARQLRVDRLVRAYLGIQSFLARDQFEGANADLREIRAAAGSLQERATGAEAQAVTHLIAAAPGSYADLKDAREKFEALSLAVLELVKVCPPSATAALSLYQAYCPMAKKMWLQAGTDIHNPYDTTMPECGQIKGDNLLAGGKE